MTDSPKNILVTGTPGVGKTTLISRVLDELGADAMGFTTEEIRVDGRRVGFSINDLAGPSGVLAHVDSPGPFRVAKYGVNKDALDRIGVPAVLAAVESGGLVVMDEIGRMELCSSRFQDAVIRALDSAAPVLGTLQDTHNAFLDAIRSRDDVLTVRVTRENRDSLVDELVERVGRLVGRSG